MEEDDIPKFPELRKFSRHSVMRNIDYSFLGANDSKVANRMGLVPVKQRDVLSKAYSGKFYKLLDKPEKGLELSAKYGFVEAFEFFEELGKMENGFFSYVGAARQAAERGHIEILNLCKDKLFRSDYDKILPFAAKEGNFEIVDLLLSWGARDVNTAMGHAAKKGNLAMVKYLRKLGAMDLQWPMSLAAKKGHLKIVKFLYEQGAGKLNNAMLEAVMHDQHKVVEYCLENGANNYERVIAIASEQGNYSMVNLIKKFQEDQSR